jgi:hypothetical protein
MFARTATAILVITGVGQRAQAAGAMVTVDDSRTTGTLAADAVGLSYEMRTVAEGGFDATTGNEAALFATLGVHHIRIGGNTVDYGTFWQQGGQPVPPWASIIITPADAARVAAFAQAIDAKVAWAVNIQHLDAKLIGDQVGTVIPAFGPALASIQCGNEPNSIFNGYAGFKSAFDVCKGAIAGRTKISGPDTFGGGGAWNATFAGDEAAVLTELNYHYYTGARAVMALLAPGVISGALSAIRGSLAAARAHGLSYRTDETNSEAGGGVHGVSDVFGSALWAMDYALATAQQGGGINFHGFLGVCGKPTVNGKDDFYTPICAADAADAAAKIMTAAPEFYGLWMASHLGPGKFHPVSVAGAANLAAYAVAADDGTTRLALIEKTPTGGTLPVTIAFGRDGGPARVIHLTGSSLNAPSGVQIQGASVDRQGHLRPGPPDQVPTINGSLSLTLPTGSAAMVTFGQPKIGGATDGGAPGADAEPGSTESDGPSPAAPDGAMTADTSPTPTTTPRRASGGGCALGGCAPLPSGMALVAAGGLLLCCRRRRLIPR